MNNVLFKPWIDRDYMPERLIYNSYFAIGEVFEDAVGNETCGNSETIGSSVGFTSVYRIAFRRCVTMFRKYQDIAYNTPIISFLLKFSNHNLTT